MLPLQFVRLYGWVRFSWDALALPRASYFYNEQYSIRRASRQEKGQVWQVVCSCFAQDSCWNDVFQILVPYLQHDLDERFAHRESECLVITHGNRIIAASAVRLDPESENHLTTGPCITSEYRNRGLGSLLLKESLLMAAGAGTTNIFGVTRITSQAGKFVYPKFGGTATSFVPDLHLDILRGYRQDRVRARAGAGKH